MTKYEKGARKERKLVKLAKLKGYYALRSAGSKGKIDVVVINQKDRKIELIQAKTYTLTPKEIKDLNREVEGIDGVYTVKFEII